MQSAQPAFHKASSHKDGLPWTNLFRSHEFSDIVSVHTRGIDSTQEKVILLDIDGVCLDMKGLSYDFFHREKGLPFIAPKDREHYIIFKNYQRLYPGVLNEEQERNHVNDFHERFDYFGNLPEVDGAKEALRDLQAMGYKFVAVTACLSNVEKGRDPDLVDQIVFNRIFNLRAVFGDDAFSSYHFVHDDLDKNRALALYPTTKFVDDSVSNCIRSQETGHEGIIFATQSFDPARNVDKQRVIHSLTELRDLIIAEQQAVAQPAAVVRPRRNRVLEFTKK